MRTRRTLYNSFAGLFYYAVTILLGIVNRKVVIEILGIEYQGINGLFSNVLSMLSIAELGIGTAIIYHLYGPIRENNIPAIRSLMQFYKKCYMVIAGIIACLGVGLIPVLPYIVAENTLPYSLAELYIWFLLDAVVSYLFTYKRSIMIADQKNYMVIGCDLVYQLVVKLGQIAVLFLTHNFICYLIVMAVTRIAENLFLNALSERMYPFLREKDAAPVSRELLEDIKQKVRGMIFHKIGSFVVLGTDNLLISKFLGLRMVGIYSNYHLIINAIKNICTQVVTAATASVGQLLTEGNREKSYEIFMEMQVFNTGLIHCAAVGIYCTATPLISLVFGEEFTLSKGTLLVLAFNFYIQGLRNVFGIFKEAAGILYEDRFVPVIESTVNLVLSLIFLRYFGIAGVFMGTIASTCIIFGYTYPFLVYKKIFARSLRGYFTELAWPLLLLSVSLYCSGRLSEIFLHQNLYGQVAANILIAVAVSTATFLGLYAVHHRESRMLVQRFLKIIKREK